MNKFLWLVRRELWESRSVWVAPAITAAIIVGGALVASFGTGAIDVNGMTAAEISRRAAELPAGKIEAFTSMSLGGIAIPFFIAVLFTQFFYIIDSLYSERRDRSILFWKSLPVSDLATVLSKLFVAAVLMPAAAAAAALLTQVAVFLIGTAKLAAVPGLIAHVWTPAIWAGSVLVLCYVLVAMALWYLPVLGWGLLVSAWAPRSPFMVASLPPLALALAEFIVFRTHYALAIIGERVGNLGFLARTFGGHPAAGFGFQVVIDKDTVTVPHSLLDLMRPLDYFTSPAVWIGVAVGVGFVAAAAWMRRYRDATG